MPFQGKQFVHEKVLNMLYSSIKYGVFGNRPESPLNELNSIEMFRIGTFKSKNNISTLVFVILDMRYPFSDRLYRCPVGITLSVVMGTGQQVMK